jgi:hypothetical protein
VLRTESICGDNEFFNGLLDHGMQETSQNVSDVGFALLPRHGIDGLIGNAVPIKMRVAPESARLTGIRQL